MTSLFRICTSAVVALIICAGLISTVAVPLHELFRHVTHLLG